jgi:hypothetical protein
VLALSDGALAQLFVSATAIPERGRRRWLQRVARELEGHQPTPLALRVRKSRARQRKGKASYRVTLDAVDLEEMLLSSGFLLPEHVDTHSEVEAALASFLQLRIADHRNQLPSEAGVYDSVRVRLVLSALRRKLRNAAQKR